MDSELAEAIQAALKCKRAASPRLVASTLGGQQLLCQVLAFPCRRGRQQPDGRRANTWLIIVDGELSKGYFNFGSLSRRPRNASNASSGKSQLALELRVQQRSRRREARATREALAPPRDGGMFGGESDREWWAYNRRRWVARCIRGWWYMPTGGSWPTWRWAAG